MPKQISVRDTPVVKTVGLTLKVAPLIVARPQLGLLHLVYISTDVVSAKVGSHIRTYFHFLFCCKIGVFLNKVSLLTVAISKIGLQPNWCLTNKQANASTTCFKILLDRSSAVGENAGSNPMT